MPSGLLDDMLSDGFLRHRTDHGDTQGRSKTVVTCCTLAVVPSCRAIHGVSSRLGGVLFGVDSQDVRAFGGRRGRWIIGPSVGRDANCASCARPSQTRASRVQNPIRLCRKGGAILPPPRVAGHEDGQLAAALRSRQPDARQGIGYRSRGRGGRE